MELEEIEISFLITYNSQKIYDNLTLYDWIKSMDAHFVMPGVAKVVRKIFRYDPRRRRTIDLHIVRTLREELKKYHTPSKKESIVVAFPSLTTTGALLTAELGTKQRYTPW